MSFAVTNNSEECEGGTWTYFDDLHDALACLVNTIGKAHAVNQPIGGWHIEEVREPLEFDKSGMCKIAGYEDESGSEPL